MKNIVNRALVAKKKQFQSKSVPRGTRTIWRYLGALFLLFTFAIGNVWAAPTDMVYAYTYSSGAVVTGPTTDDFFTPSAPTFTGANYEAKSNSSRLRYSTKSAGAEATVSFQFTAKDALNISAITMNNCANSDKIKAVKIRYRINTGSWSTDQATTVPKSDLGDTEVTLPSAGLELAEDDVLIIQVDLKNTDTGTSGRAWDINTITIATEAAGGGGSDPVDETAPTLASSVPANAATNVAVSGNIVLTFNETIASVDASKFTLTGATKGTVAIDGTDAKKVNVGYTAENDASVTLAVAAEAVEDAAGNKSAELSNISFTTVAAAPAPDVVLNNNGTLNSTDFVTLVSELDGDDYSVSSVAYTNNFKFGNTCSSIVNQSWSNKYLAYDVKTTSATLKLYVYNKNSNSKNLYYQVLSETGNGDFKTESITSKGNGKIIEIPVTATKGTRVVFGANSTDVRMCQLEVYENGTTLTKAGEVGYELALKGRPFATGSSNLFSGNIDGMEYVLYSELKLVNNNAYSVMRNNDGTHYFKIPATNDVQLKVTTDNSAKFYVLGSAVAGDPDKDVQYGGEAGTFNVNLPHKDGYWYIIPVVAATGTGNEVRISKIAFATMPAGLSVTYNAGEGAVKEGKSLPTHADAYEGDKIVLASGENLEKSGYDFTGWKANGTGDLLLPGDKYTMTDAPVEFVAQWTLHVAKYGVKFMDGTTKLDSLSVTLGQAPVFADPTQALYTFAGWKDGGDNDVTLSDLATSVTVENTVVVLYAQWTKAYVPQGASYVFENTATVGTTYSITVTKDNQPNAIAADSRIDNMWLSAMSVKLEDGTYSGSGDDFKGWKINTASATIRFYVENDSRVTVTVGNLTSGLNITYTAKNATEEATTALTAKAANPYDVKGGTLVTLTTGGGSTVTLKGIAVSAIPALDDDATLSDLKVGGVTVAGFSANTHTYYYELPYGTAVGDIPTISATANSAKAKQVAIEQAVWTGDPYNCYRAQANVQAEDESWGYYDVQFSFAPKYGVELIKATHDGTASGATITGYIGGQKDKDTYANGKLGEIGKYFGIKLADGNFQAGDLVEVKVSMFEGGNTATMFTDKGETPLSSGAFDVNNKVYRFTLTAETEWIYIYRKDGTCNPRVQSIAVYRQMNPFIEEFKIGEAVGTITGTNIAIELPYGTSLYGVAATIEAYANGGATVIAPTPLAYDTPLGYKVSSAYAEDGDVDYTVTITEAEHYEAMIVGGESYTTLAAAVAAAQADDVVKLLDNVDLMATGLTIAENITLDLNGFNIKAGEQIDNDILVPAGKKLTLVDNSANAEGKIYTEQAYTGAVTGYGLIRVAGELLMQSGNIYAVIDSDPANLGQFAVVIAAGGKVTVEGGQIKAGWYAISNNGNNTGSTIIVSGGELISTADFAIYNPAKESTVTVSGGVVYGAAGGIAMNRGELTVTGGTITSKDQGTTGTWGDGTGGLSNAAISASGKYESVNVEISGGTIVADGTAVMITNGTTNPVEIAISGGQFSHVVPAEYCAKDFIPVTTPNAQGKYEVIAAGIIRGAAVTNTDGVYYYTLDNGVTIYSSNSEGQLSTSTMTSTSSDVTACGGAEGGYNVNKSAFVLKFPVNVKEFTLYGANSTERTISKIYVNAEGSKTIKISTDGDELTGTYTNTKDGKCQALTAAFNDANIIPANYYVLVKLDGSVNFYRVLYTEAECTTPTVTLADKSAYAGSEVTLTAEASALGASYTWYRCTDATGANPQVITGETTASYTFTKAAGDEFFKVVVACNCSDETAEDVATVTERVDVTLQDVTGSITWDFSKTGITAETNIDAETVMANIPAVNNDENFWSDKIQAGEGKLRVGYYQGGKLMFHTTVPGLLKVEFSNTGSSARPYRELLVNGNPTDAKSKDNTHVTYTVAVKSGDIELTARIYDNDGNPTANTSTLNFYLVDFDADLSNNTITEDAFNGYTRDVTEGRYGTICLPNGGIMVGAELFEIAYYGETSHKIFLDNIPSGEMVAGRPYIFLPKEGTTQLAVFYTDEANASAGSHNGLIGFIGAAADAYFYIPAGEGNYILQNNLYREVLAGGQARILSNRAYIKLAAITPTEPALAPGRRRVAMGVQSEQVATGCENLNVSDKPVKMIIDGQLFILRGEKMYDAKGQLVK